MRPTVSLQLVWMRYTLAGGILECDANCSIRQRTDTTRGQGNVRRRETNDWHGTGRGPEVEYTVACLVAVVGLSACRAVIDGTVQQKAGASLAYAKEESQRLGLPGVVAERPGELPK